MGRRHDSRRADARLTVVAAIVIGVAALVIVVAAAAALGGVGGLTWSTNGPAATASPPSDDGIETPNRCTGNETSPGFEAVDGTLASVRGGFRLTSSADAVARGERISFSLTNVAEERKYTGTHAKYALQRRGQTDWEMVTRFREPSLGFNGTAVVHDPGSGFEWSFRASADGFSEGKYVVCERLEAGAYRFVYVNERPLAVEFEVVDGARNRTGG